MTRSDVLFLCLAALGLTAPPASALCPPSVVVCGSGDPEILDAPVFECVCSPSDPRCVLRQDAELGILHCEKLGPGGDAADVTAIDEFVVRDLPSGTPVSCTVRLSLTGGTYMPVAPESLYSARAVCLASLDGGSGTASEILELMAADASGMLDLPASAHVACPLTVVAGESFLLRYRLLATASGGSEIVVTARLQFGDLPDGATVESCRGFRRSPGVPANASSWGALKHSYR